MILQGRLVVVSHSQVMLSLHQEVIAQALMLVVMHYSSPVGRQLVYLIQDFAFHQPSMAHQHVGHP